MGYQVSKYRVTPKIKVDWDMSPRFFDTLEEAMAFAKCEPPDLEMAVAEIQNEFIEDVIEYQIESVDGAGRAKLLTTVPQWPTEADFEECEAEAREGAEAVGQAMLDAGQRELERRAAAANAAGSWLPTK